MSLLNPIWLWGLSALAIPVGIHLLSRKEGKTIRIGSLRFLSETSTSKFSSIRLNEVALLTLRSLLIILIVFFLADLLITKTNSTTSRKWALVEQGLENQSHINTVLDSLQKNDFEIRRLAENFPLMNRDTTGKHPDYYKLTELLAKEKDLQTIVFATNSLSGFKGKRISLPEHISWIVSESLVPDKNPKTVADTITILLVYDKDFLEDKRILKAALKTIQSSTIAITISETEISQYQSTQQADWIMWLSNEDLTTDTKTLYYEENRLNNLITQETATRWTLSKHLTEAIAIEDHLPVQLIEMLFDQPIQDNISSNDTRIVNDRLTWSQTDRTQISIAGTATHSFNKILLIAIVLLLIAERILAYYRKQ